MRSDAPSAASLTGPLACLLRLSPGLALLPSAGPPLPPYPPAAAVSARRRVVDSSSDWTIVRNLDSYTGIQFNSCKAIYALRRHAAAM